MTGQVAQAHILSGQPMLLLGYARSPDHPYSTAETEAAGKGWGQILAQPRWLD